MTFVSSAGARIPHAKAAPIDIAVFSLPGGTHSASPTGAGESVGRRVRSGLSLVQAAVQAPRCASTRR